VKHAYQRFDNRLLAAIRTVTAVLLSVMFVVIIAGVFFRYVLGSALFWSEELARVLMFYMVLIGSAAAIRQKQHPALLLVTSKLPASLGRKWAIVLDLLVCFVLVIIFWQGLLMAVDEWIGRTPALRISFFWVYLALPIGAALMICEIALGYIVGNAQAGKTDGDIEGRGL